MTRTQRARATMRPLLLRPIWALAEATIHLARDGALRQRIGRTAGRRCLAAGAVLQVMGSELRYGFTTDADGAVQVKHMSSTATSPTCTHEAPRRPGPRRTRPGRRAGCSGSTSIGPASATRSGFRYRESPATTGTSSTSKIGSATLSAVRTGPWLVRTTLGDYQVGDYILPAGAMVVVSQFLMHRDPRYYPSPERFDPERWTPEARAARPPCSFFPFGGGPRRCIGEGLAAWRGCSCWRRSLPAGDCR